jgi:signal transduction histidine kinase
MPKPSSKKPATILIVDDEETVRVLLSRALAADDRVITLAGSVSEALGQMTKIQFDLLVVDKNLPDGSGLDIINKGRNLGQKPEAIVITGYSDMDSAIKAVSLGVFRYVPKPFSLDTLKVDVHRAIETGRIRRELAQRSEQLKRTNEDLNAALQMVKQSESRRMQVERLATIGYLAAGVAHEINNPLSLLSMSVPFTVSEVRQINDALRRAPDTPIDADRLARIVRTLEPSVEAIEFLMALAADLHSLGGTIDEPPKAIKVSEAASAALRLVRHQIKHKARCRSQIPAELAIEGRSSRLIQVFINLLTNASRAIREGNIDDNEVALDGELTGTSAVIRISDTGVGIPPESLGQIFTPFWTAAGPSGEQGSGIGLAIVKEIIDELNGTIQVASEQGKGTTFTLTFPATSLRASVAGVPAVSRLEPAVSVRSRRTILFLDPDPGNLEDYRDTFGQMHDLKLASDIEAARACLDEHGAAIDIIVSELLPADHPLTVFRDEVTGRFPDLQDRFIFLGEPGPLANAAKTEKLRFLHKPVRPAALLAEIFSLPPRGATTNNPP